MRIGSLFSGIGGLELGLEWSGLGHTVWQVEQDPYCLAVLEKHWPDAERYHNVKEVGANLPRVDLICGGFPCQDVSSAGKGAGLAGERSGLWFEFARIVEEVRPGWVVVENVASGAKRWVDAVVAGLESRGYEALPIPLSAEAVGAPHRRARVFVVAYSEREHLREQPGRRCGPDGACSSFSALDGAVRVAAHAHREGERPQSVNGQVGRQPASHGAAAYTGGGRQQARGQKAPPQIEQWTRSDDGSWRPPVSLVCGVDDGIPDRMDRLRGLGNAVVPQCAEVIGHVILKLARPEATQADSPKGKDHD